MRVINGSDINNFILDVEKIITLYSFKYLVSHFVVVLFIEFSFYLFNSSFSSFNLLFSSTNLL